MSKKIVRILENKYLDQIWRLARYLTGFEAWYTLYIVEQAYKLDRDGNAVSVIDKPGRKGRVCTVCLNVDRDAIDKSLLQGYTFAAVAAEYGLKAFTLARHFNGGHTQHAIAKSVDKAQSLSMESILDSVLVSRNRARARAEYAKEAYYPQTERVSIEADKLLSSIVIESSKFKLEQDKQDKLSNTSDNTKYLRLIDYLRLHLPDHLVPACEYAEAK